MRMIHRETEMLDQEIKRTEELIRQLRSVEKSTETSNDRVDTRRKKDAATNTPHDWQAVRSTKFTQ